MTHPLTEKIVEAVMRLGAPRFPFSEQHESNLRTAIQSVLDGEGRVDLNEVAEKIINTLDDEAREFDHYEYGLPVMFKMDAMKELVLPYLTDLSQLKEGGV